MPLRLVFMGTPDFAVPTLVEIVGRGHEVAAVYTRAAKPAGRGMELQPTPVEREARRFGLSAPRRRQAMMSGSSFASSLMMRSLSASLRFFRRCRCK